MIKEKALSQLLPWLGPEFKPLFPLGKIPQIYHFFEPKGHLILTGKEVTFKKAIVEANVIF